MAETKPTTTKAGVEKQMTPEEEAAAAAAAVPTPTQEEADEIKRKAATVEPAVEAKTAKAKETSPSKEAQRDAAADTPSSYKTR